MKRGCCLSVLRQIKLSATCLFYCNLIPKDLFFFFALNLFQSAEMQITPHKDFPNREQVSISSLSNFTFILYSLKVYSLDGITEFRDK